MMEEKIMGAISGSREPSQSSLSRPVGFDPERDVCIYYMGQIRHSESGMWHRTCTEATEEDAASWAAQQCLGDNDEWRVVKVIEQEVARG